MNVCDSLCSEFETLGYVARGLASWQELDDAALKSHALLVLDLRFGATWNSVLKALPRWREVAPALRIAITTNHGSVATAIESVRAGADAYLPKPVSASQILHAVKREPLATDEAEAMRPFTLDRAIWEYLNQVLISSSSLAHAARSLGVDRRSLRRMLNKYAPR